MRQITGLTKQLCVIGSPVTHSFSPAMHNAALEALDLDYVYTAFEVSKEHISDAIRGLLHLGVVGCNVTMPGKTIVADLADELSPVAMLSHSVNTVVFRDGRIYGDSTDGIGFMSSVSHAGVNLIGQHLTVLGAGGAATAIIVQAALDGVSEISVFRRRSSLWQQTEDFAARISAETGCRIAVYDLADTDALRAQIADSAVLVNATNVGMMPDSDACLIPDASFLHPELLVSDIIYHPLETRLMALAKEVGCKVSGGLSMLLHQGAASFRLFTGQTMPIETVAAQVFPELYEAEFRTSRA